MPTLSIHSSAVYQIRLHGVLEESWQDNIGDCRIVSYRSGENEEASQTILIGKVRDQAALAGILNLVYNLGLPLLDVHCLGQALEDVDASQP